MSEVTSLVKRINAMLATIHQAQERFTPSFTVIEYRPLEDPCPGGLEDYHRLIAEQQPEVAEQLKQSREQGIRVFVWLPAKDDTPEGYIA